MSGGPVRGGRSGAGSRCVRRCVEGSGGRAPEAPCGPGAEKVALVSTGSLPADRDSGRTARLVRDSWDACVMVSALDSAGAPSSRNVTARMSCPMTRRGGMHRKVGGGDVVAWYAPVWAVRRVRRRRNGNSAIGAQPACVNACRGRRLGAGAGRQRYAKRTGMIGSPAEVLQGDGDCPSSHKGMNGADGSLRSCSFRNSSITRSLGECKRDRRHPRVAVEDDCDWVSNRRDVRASAHKRVRWSPDNGSTATWRRGWHRSRACPVRTLNRHLAPTPPAPITDNLCAVP